MSHIKYWKQPCIPTNTQVCWFAWNCPYELIHRTSPLWNQLQLVLDWSLHFPKTHATATAVRSFFGLVRFSLWSFCGPRTRLLNAIHECHRSHHSTHWGTVPAIWWYNITVSLNLVELLCGLHRCILVTSAKWSFSFHHLLFIWHMLRCLHEMISNWRSETIQGSGHTSKMWLVHLMEATSMPHHLQKIGEHSEITKALSHKIASLHAALTFNLLTPSLGGRALQLMHVSTRMLVKKTYTLRKANISWLTLDIHIAPSFLYLIGTLAIILQSGGMQHWGMYN